MGGLELLNHINHDTLRWCAIGTAPAGHSGPIPVHGTGTTLPASFGGAVGSGTTSRINPEASLWINQPEVTATLGLGAWSLPDPALVRQMEQLATKAEVQALAVKVETLAHALRGAPGAGVGIVTTEAQVGPITVAMVTDAAADGSLSDLFDQIADDHLEAPQGVAEIAIAALGQNDPSLRAAAARVVCLLAPSRARELLEPMIPSEKNKFTQAIMRGALRAIG